MSTNLAWRATVGWFTLLAAACTAPIAYGRTGQVLDAGAFRVSISTTNGMRFTRAELVKADPNSAPSSANGATSGGGFSAAFGLLASWELQASISPWGRCELGGLVSFVRAGGELRCGTLPRELGPVSAALSVGASTTSEEPGGFAPRAGLDLSLGSGPVIPFVDVYVGHQARRYAVDELDLYRNEWRLSVPLGVSFNLARDEIPYPAFSVAITPEMMFASTPLPGSHLSSPEGTFRMHQRWAIFLSLRIEFEAAFTAL